MSSRTARIILAIVAGVAALAIVGAVAFSIGAHNGDRVPFGFGPMRGYMNGRSFGLGGAWLLWGLIPMVLIVIGVIWLLAVIFGGDRDRYPRNQYPPAQPPAAGQPLAGQPLAGQTPPGQTPPGQTPPGQPPVSDQPPIQGAPAAWEGLDRLRELSDMHDRGALTDEEFTAAKRKLLGI